MLKQRNAKMLKDQNAEMLMQRFPVIPSDRFHSPLKPTAVTSPGTTSCRLQ